MTPVASQGRQSRPTLEADLLLLVEGKDEVNLFEAIVKHCLEGGSQQVQVLEVGGKDQFRKLFAAIKIAAQARPTLRSIGVVRDADDNARGSFQSVCDSIRNVDYEPPARHGEFSNAAPSIGVFIVPDGSETGAIETLCRQSVQDTPAAKCVDEYLGYLTTRNALESRNAYKTFTHAYLAAGQNPVARVGEGAQQGVWNFQSPAFMDLCKFIRKLASRDRGDEPLGPSSA